MKVTSPSYDEVAERKDFTPIDIMKNGNDFHSQKLRRIKTLVQNQRKASVINSPVLSGSSRGSSEFKFGSPKQYRMVVQVNSKSRPSQPVTSKDKRVSNLVKKTLNMIN